MHTMRVTAKAALLLAAAHACCSASGQEEYETWNLEPGVSQAHLVMVARVARVSSVTFVEGAKTDTALREYRFQPVRVLKGIFPRAELSMTASDLGLASEDGSAPAPLVEGEHRLLILVQQQGPMNMGCVSAAPGATTFNERVPLLAGPDDPLVATVETLIRVADSRSRRERATLLVDRLESASGLSAVPLLTSLQLRADWAAADGRAYASIARLAQERVRPVRAGALTLLRDMLASRAAPPNPGQFDGVATALSEAIQSEAPITQNRLAAIEALGYLLPLEADLAWPREFLAGDIDSAATYAERLAAATALSHLRNSESATAVLEALAPLPLDEPAERELEYARAAARLDRAGAERELVARLQRSIAARQSLKAEIVALGGMRTEASVPLLLDAGKRINLNQEDRFHIAWALGRLRDERALPLLTDWMRGNDFYLKALALTALEKLDTAAAAEAVRPLLKTEAHLPYKLRLARLLARHKVADGYSLAVEHLADEAHTAAATLVLAALDDPRTEADLSAMLAGPPDRRWRAAALTGLAAVGNEDARRQLREILADDRNPLAAAAAEAAGLAGDDDLLRPLAKLVTSRNRRIALASLVAARRALSGVRSSPRGLAVAEQLDWDLNEGSAFVEGFDDGRTDGDDPPAPVAELSAATRDALFEAAATLAADAYVDADLRREALPVTRLLGGAGFGELLSELADQAELEGTPLLAEVKAERRLQGVVAQP